MTTTTTMNDADTATAPIAPPAPPLIERLVRDCGAAWVDEASLDAWSSGAGDRVLFLAGDPVRFPECLDVAVVLPELQAAFGGRFMVGAVRADSEQAVARRFGSNRWPSLVFLRDGRYVATVAGMHGWDDYLQRVGDALASEPTRAPTIGIAVVSADGGAACH